MQVRGTQRNILKTIAKLQEQISSSQVEDLEIAEAIELDVNAIQLSLEFMERDGYVELERIERLAGTGYAASLTEQGRQTLS